MNHRVARFDAAQSDVWDDLVRRAPMGTFLHTRRFLGYHGDRFEDVSLVVANARDELVAVLPAAVDPGDRTSVSSHPGITYGGLVHDGRLVGERMLDAVDAVAVHYAEHGFDSLTYKAVPHIYQRVPSADDLYALFRREATLVRSDLSTAIDLEERAEPRERRRRAQAKAVRAGVSIVDGRDRINELWQVVEDTLTERHGVSPVHSADEIRYLHSLFPGEIRFLVAEIDSRVVAGLVLFEFLRATHVQYSAANEEGREASALDFTLETAIVGARERGARFFDFGISTVQGGRQLNEGLHRYKVEFGGGGVVHEFYELQLGKSSP